METIEDRGSMTRIALPARLCCLFLLAPAPPVHAVEDLFTASEYDYWLVLSGDYKIPPDTGVIHYAPSNILGFGPSFFHFVDIQDAGPVQQPSTWYYCLGRFSLTTRSFYGWFYGAHYPWWQGGGLGFNFFDSALASMSNSRHMLQAVGWSSRRDPTSMLVCRLTIRTRRCRMRPSMPPHVPRARARSGNQLQNRWSVSATTRMDPDI